MLDRSSEPASTLRADTAPDAGVGPLVRHRPRTSLRHPAVLFALMSVLFGTVVILLTPPMRGPDEAAHFLRAYGFVHGEIIATETDSEGRKGLFLPARLYRDFELFESNRYRIWDQGFSYREVFAESARRRAEPAAEGDDAPVFVIFNGSEGYSPFSYLPYLPALVAARIAGLDFPATIYLMRFMGLLAMTAIAAYAIAVVPRLGWGLLCIAMLPAALYGRCVISADGGTLSYTMVVAAICLRGAQTPMGEKSWEHGLWMTLCILSKPPQLAFMLLEALRWPLRELPRHWRALACIILPGVALTVAWTAATSGDVAQWRLTGGTGLPPEQFEAAWKLGFMLEHPLHFPTVMATTIVNHVPDLWRQLIGMLGWLDTRLAAWAYPVLSVLLIGACITSLDLDRVLRLRVASVCALTVIGYCVAVFLIFFLIWTPADWDQIEGVQGRYFIAVLPALAFVPAALMRRGLPAHFNAIAALAAAAISGGAIIEALLRVDWRW